MMTPEPLLASWRWLGLRPYHGESGSVKNGSESAGPPRTAFAVEMLTTLSTTRSATSGIDASVIDDGARCANAGRVSVCNAAPAPIKPARAAAPIHVRKVF